MMGEASLLIKPFALHLKLKLKYQIHTLFEDKIGKH